MRGQRLPRASVASAFAATVALSDVLEATVCFNSGLAAAHNANIAFAAAPDAVFGAEIPRRINAVLAVVGFQRHFFGETHSNSVPAAPELVEMLMRLPDDVDALRAAAVVCDDRGKINSPHNVREQKAFVGKLIH